MDIRSLSGMWLNFKILVFQFVRVYKDIRGLVSIMKTVTLDATSVTRNFFKGRETSGPIFVVCVQQFTQVTFSLR